MDKYVAFEYAVLELKETGMLDVNQILPTLSEEEISYNRNVSYEKKKKRGSIVSTSFYNEDNVDVDEKFIRREAKKMFSSVYNLTSTCFAEKLISMQDCVNGHIQYLIEQKYELLERKFCLEHLLKDETDILTDLYDSYYKEKSIKKEHFDSLRKHFGQVLSSAREEIKNCDNMLIMLKREKKDVESLLVTE